MSWKQLLKNEVMPNRENERDIYERIKELILDAEDIRAEIKELDEAYRKAKDAKDEELARNVGLSLTDSLESLKDIAALIEKLKLRLTPDTGTQYWLERDDPPRPRGKE